MARDAPPHVVDVVDLEHLRHTGDVAVAGHAGVGPHRLDVTHVRKVCVPGQGMDTLPFDGLSGGVGITQLGDLGPRSVVGSSDHQVASHASLHAGDAGLLRGLNRKVTVLALDLELPGVDVVPEEHRLARSGKFGRVAGGERRRRERVAQCRALGKNRRATAESHQGTEDHYRKHTHDHSQLTHCRSPSMSVSGPAGVPHRAHTQPGGKSNVNLIVVGGPGHRTPQLRAKYSDSGPLHKVSDGVRFFRSCPSSWPSGGPPGLVSPP